MPSSMECGRVDLAAESAPSGCRPEVAYRVGRLVMVENVGEDGLEFNAEALVDVNVFLNWKSTFQKGMPRTIPPPPAPPSRPRITPLENSKSHHSKDPVPIQACASDFKLFL